MKPEHTEEDNLYLRSEEVQEILTKPPVWIVRWGITLVFIMTSIIVILSFLIKYPDTISARVMVTTKSPTEKIVSRFSGQIDKIFVANRDTVRANQRLAIIRNTAKYQDVFELKHIIDTVTFDVNNFNFPFEDTVYFILGDIESAYINFEKSYMDYFLLKKLDPHSNKLRGDKISINEVKNRLRNEVAKKKLLIKEAELGQVQYERQKQLYSKGIISKQDFELKELEYIQLQKNIKNINISISQMREAISSANQNYRETSIDEEKQDSEFKRNLIQSYEALIDAIRKWEYNYVLSSSIDGIVSFQDYWGANQYVTSNSIVFSILPTTTSDLIGKLTIPSQNSGKVSVGQKVFVKLDNYPYQQYGMLIGKVQDFSVSPDSEGNYTVYVSLPKGTKTSYNKTLKFMQELIGSAEIVTEDLSVSERIFYKFKDLFKYQS